MRVLLTLFYGLVLLTLIFAAGCGERPAPAPVPLITLREAAVVAIAVEKEACGPNEDAALARKGWQQCELYATLENGAILHIAEVRDGIPYVKRYRTAALERYADWSTAFDGSLEDQNKEVHMRFYGPYDDYHQAVRSQFFGEAERT